MCIKAHKALWESEGKKVSPLKNGAGKSNYQKNTPVIFVC
jgi:hypothetical protein